MKRLDHVGIAVPDLAAARNLWDALLNQRPELEDVPTQKVHAACYPCGIELFAPSSEDSPISRFLRKRGGGIHRVTIEVGDLDANLARLKEQGFELINEQAVTGAGGHRVAFLHPRAAGGVLVELKESTRE